MSPQTCPTAEQDDDRLCRPFDRPLRAIARSCVKLWFNRNRLDAFLSESVRRFYDCELIYAIGADGRQVSSNVYRESVDRSAYGQDLSRRPYVVSLAVLNDPGALQGAFLCDTYISRVTQRPCVTVMYRVRSGGSLLGYIAGDFRAIS